MSAPPIKNKQALSCKVKNRFSDESAARVSAQHAINTYKNEAILWVYQCKLCRGWHLTKSRQHGSAGVTAEDLYHDEIAADFGELP